MIIPIIAMHTRSESLVPQSVVRTGALVGHRQPQTTALYDRRERRLARSLVERISI